MKSLTEPRTRGMGCDLARPPGRASRSVVFRCVVPHMHHIMSRMKINPRYLSQWADVRVRHARLGTGRDRIETVKTRGYNTTPEALALGSG